MRGLGSKAVKISKDVSPLASGIAKAAIAGRDSCSAVVLFVDKLLVRKPESAA
jgi:hypothetical protein